MTRGGLRQHIWNPGRISSVCSFGPFSGEFRKPRNGIFRRLPAAFTLPELLITLLLISILFSVMIIFTSSFGGTKKLRTNEIAIAFAQQAIEVVRSAPFHMLDDDDFPKGEKEKSVEWDLNNAHGNIDLFEPTFMTGKVKIERTVKITNVEPAVKGGTPPRLKHVRVEVVWPLPNGKKTNWVINSTIADVN